MKILPLKISWSSTLMAALLAPLAVLLLTEACSPMKGQAGGNSVAASDTNICSDIYKAPASLTSKSSTQNLTTFFDQQKNQLPSTLLGKATNNLKNTQILVTLETSCTASENSLSAKVLAQNTGDTRAVFKRKAYPFLINEDLDIDTLTAMAENDPCVVGFTNPGRLFKSSLPLPDLNDPGSSKQLHMSTINFSHAYEYLIKQMTSGTSVKVGFIDTGVDCDHPDLVGNLVSTCGFDAVNGQQPTDNDGHGTHTMGLTGASMNNSNGVSGLIGNNIELHAIRVIDVGSGTVQDAYDGIQHAIAENLDVINISLESQTRLPQIEQGVQEAVNAGIVVVMAAGNQSLKLGTDIEVSPAMIGSGLDGAITVGSMDTLTGLLSSFSNYGASVEIAAPGATDSSLMSEAGGLYSSTKNDNYQKMMGTSQAAPIITAAAAILIQFFKQNNVFYSPADIEQIILASTDKDSRLAIAGNGRAINFSKLTRNAYAFAGIELCQ